MTYEYMCEACGHQWEAEQSIKDRALKKCVSCGKQRAKRLVSGGTGFLLKGGGWYADLYGSAKAKPQGSSEASDKSEKTDAKPTASEGSTKDAGSKEGGAKDGGAKDGGAKDAGTKDTKPASSNSGGSSGGAASSPASS
jgi:putative FmdB family regulatory protein